MIEHCVVGSNLVASSVGLWDVSLSSRPSGHTSDV